MRLARRRFCIVPGLKTGIWFRGARHRRFLFPRSVVFNSAPLLRVEPTRPKCRVNLYLKAVSQSIGLIGHADDTH